MVKQAWAALSLLPPVALVAFVVRAYGEVDQAPYVTERMLSAEKREVAGKVLQSERLSQSWLK